MSCTFWLRRKQRAAKLKAESIAAEKSNATPTTKTVKAVEKKVAQGETKPVKKAGAKKNDNAETV